MGGFQNENDNNNEDQHLENGDKKKVFSSQLIGWGFLILIGFLVFYLRGREPAPRTEINYTKFREQVKAGNVVEVLVTGDRIEGRYLSPVEQVSPTGERVQFDEFITYLPSFNDTDLLSLLENQQVELRARPVSELSGWGAVFNILPIVLFLGLGFMLFRRFQSQGQGMVTNLKSRAKRYERKKEAVTFADVAGAAGAKQELLEIIQFLKEPDRFQSLGAKIPKGVLLVGPPGTGKTLLARAVAGEADANFFSITGSDFMEMYVGVGASRVRDLFEQAKTNTPAIIFIDELDSIGRKRGAGLGGGHDEREQTLNQMLSEMDGFELNENVIIMAATNRPDILDSALLRPGRFDRQVLVDLPTLQERLEILKIHARNKSLAGEVDMEKVARGTPGFSGADLANLLNEAALLAVRQGKDQIDNWDISEAADKVIMGLERNLALTEEDSRMLAYHEAGHAVVGAVLPHADPVHKVTIIPRGRAMGVTQQLPERDRYLFRKEYMLDRMAVMMGGRAAEELAMHTMTSGAADDLKRATQLARKMLLEWGMSERLGRVVLADDNQEVFLGDEIVRGRNFSEVTAREIDEEVRHVLDEAYTRAMQTLLEHRPGLERVVAGLLEKEQLSGEELLGLLGWVPGTRAAHREEGTVPVTQPQPDLSEK